MADNKPHAVYPGGPPCNPHCPGEWSQYHDGYADGYERAEAGALRTKTPVANWCRAHKTNDACPELCPRGGGYFHGHTPCADHPDYGCRPQGKV